MSWIQQMLPEHIQNLVPYASAGRANVSGEVWLNANENPNEKRSGGLSSAMNRYPQFQPVELLQGYANYAKCSTEKLLVTRGIDEGIDLLLRAFCMPGIDRIIYTPPTYGMYKISAEALGIQTIRVPLTEDFQLDIEGLEKAIKDQDPDTEVLEVQTTGLERAESETGSANTPRPSTQLQSPLSSFDGLRMTSYDKAGRMTPSLDTSGASVSRKTPKLIFLCSPNNPTGNLLARESIYRVLDATAGKALVILDEAYIEFSPEDSFVDELDNYENLVIARTMSKGFGLAGLRCGFVMASPEIIAVLRKVSAPYPIPVPVVDLVSNALRPEGILQMQTEVFDITGNRSSLESQIENLPFIKQIYPSFANFLLLEVLDSETLISFLSSKGIIIRDQSHHDRLGNCIRISIGTKEEQDVLLKALKTYGDQL